MKIAPRLGIEPITSSELEECLQADVPKQADGITSLARAQAELEFGNRLAGYPLVAKVLRGYASGVRTLTILEVTGLEPSPVDVKNQAGNTFTGGSCNSAVTTTNANDLVLNFCMDNSASTNWVAQSPWLGVITTTGGYSSGVESQNIGTLGTFTPSWNPSSVGGDYANITIAYKAGSPLKPDPQTPVAIITEMHNGVIAETSGARS